MHAIHHNLIRPRLIARHQNKLALSDEQKDFIKKQIRENQSTIADLEWDLANRVNHRLHLNRGQLVAFARTGGLGP